MTTLLVAMIIIVLLVLLKVSLIVKETYTDTHLYYRSKCYSCEQDLIQRYGPEYAYLGQPTKGFSEEKELIDRTGRVEAAFGSHPISF